MNVEQLSHGPPQPKPVYIEASKPKIMNSYIVVGGIILLIFGVAIFMWSYNQIQDYQTSLGQLGRVFSADEEARYNEMQIVQILGVVFGIAGIGALIFGAAKKQAPRPDATPAS